VGSTIPDLSAPTRARTLKGGENKRSGEITPEYLSLVMRKRVFECKF